MQKSTRLSSAVGSAGAFVHPGSSAFSVSPVRYDQFDAVTLGESFVQWIAIVAWSCQRQPPFFVGTRVASIAHSERSRPPRRMRSSAKALSICTHSPERFHAWKRRWQVAGEGYRSGRPKPARPGLHHSEDAVDDAAVVELEATPARGRLRKQRLQHSPLRIGEFRRQLQ